MPSSSSSPKRPITLAEFLAPGGPMRVIAHRGLSGLAPENTLAAFRQAIETGADMIELDVTLSRDGGIVVIHDDVLDVTTSGRGEVQARTLAELRALDAGAWFAPEHTGEKIPLLSEVLDLARGRMLLNIEIKPEAVESGGAFNIAEKTAAMIQDRGMEKQVIISSFSPRALLLMAQAAPGIKRAVLFNSAIQKDQSVTEILRAAGACSFNLSREEASRAIVNECASAGAVVMVYTVNDPRTVKRMQTMGVHAIFTDHAEMALRMTRRAK